MVEGDIYRHDNLPDRAAKRLATFPKHFHEGSVGNIVESRIGDDPDQAIRQFLAFVREVLECGRKSTP